MTETRARRGPGVVVPPPLFFIAGLLIAWLLDRQLSFSIDQDGAGTVQTALGVAAIAAGFGVMLWGMVTFTRARTAIYPNQPARLIVTSGPYRFSRNPMYVGLTVAYLGGALVLNAAWPLVLLPAVLWSVYAGVIAREERYLHAEFGAAYDAYCRRVRRWL